MSSRGVSQAEGAATGARRIKLLLLRILRWSGVFAVSSVQCRRKLRILCYHGFELDDETLFRPQLFISGHVFRQRLQYLKERNFNVLPLSEALERMRQGTLPDRALCITIDDGFVSTRTIAQPILREFSFPATVYVTSYYVFKRVPIFRLGVQYAFWRANGSQASIPDLMQRLGIELDAGRSDTADGAMWAIIRHGEQMDSEAERQSLLDAVAGYLRVDIEAVRRKEKLSIMAPDEVRQLADEGVEIALHTHRHRFPKEDRAAAEREIDDNRSYLRKCAPDVSANFCYPSGIFDPLQWSWLSALGVASATTCLPGVNTAETPRYGLMRFLDSQAIDPLEFEAEVCGFNDLVRKVRLYAQRMREHVSAMASVRAANGVLPSSNSTVELNRDMR